MPKRKDISSLFLERGGERVPVGQCVIAFCDIIKGCWHTVFLAKGCKNQRYWTDLKQVLLSLKQWILQKVSSSQLPILTFSVSKIPSLEPSVNVAYTSH